jgi:hypothetical protein
MIANFPRSACKDTTPRRDSMSSSLAVALASFATKESSARLSVAMSSLKPPTATRKEKIEADVLGLSRPNSLSLARNNASKCKGSSWSGHAKKWCAQAAIAMRFGHSGYRDTPAAVEAVARISS